MRRQVREELFQILSSGTLGTACYSGGWTTSPDLNQTTIAGAGDGKAEATSHSWNESPSIGRLCGSVFASTLFKTLSSAASPLLEADFASDPSQAHMREQRHATLEFPKLNFSAQDDAWGYS
ncbi:hypothetical protein N7449_005533 [Penicillium cf. viridicatum]|uniref:Uncharacterized protein n=1 Tax=Penicillium cf. viridicatum TaxID=2972119 RepID=A0A9W9MLG6_9EURO|nr:hypothetical protein N7449_005533 [Penicillium cf. viridicatum]